jgi:DNA-binding response OmpR family regulator
MARILICEPHPDIRSLLSFVVRRLGHEPVISDGSRTQLFGVDAVVLEPGHEEALGLATWVREHAPSTAIVCASIYPPWGDTEALHPDAYLVKPFPLFRLENALASALERRGAASAVG